MGHGSCARQQEGTAPSLNLSVKAVFGVMIWAIASEKSKLEENCWHEWRLPFRFACYTCIMQFKSIAWVCESTCAGKPFSSTDQSWNGTDQCSFFSLLILFEYAEFFFWGLSRAPCFAHLEQKK